MGGFEGPKALWIWTNEVNGITGEKILKDYLRDGFCEDLTVEGFEGLVGPSCGALVADSGRFEE